MASESVVNYGVSKEEAANWLLAYQTKWAEICLNEIGRNSEWIQKFMQTLEQYDKRISISLLHMVLKSFLRL